MAHIIADRVQETSTTVGIGTLTLAGAVTGFRTFGSVMANGDTIYYTITDQTSSANWEVGIGTWSTGGTLARTTILGSSTGSAVNFTSGALYVFGTYPAGKAVYEDLNDRVGLTASTSGSANQGAIYYGTLGYSDQNTLASFQSSVNAYNQIVVQNTSSGVSASADLTISNNLGTASTYYANFGINSSGFSGTGSFNLPNAAYVGAAGGATASDLVLGTFSSTAAGAIHFVINGGATDAANINTSGRTFIGGSTSATSLLHLAAGTSAASTAPLKFTSGTNLATVEAGSVEYDGTKWFGTTGETGSSRSVLDNAYYYYVNATSGNIGTAIADLFATAAFTMQAGGIYAIEWHPYLTKTTAGTYVFTVTTTQTPVSVTAGFINAQSALTASNAVVAGATTTTALPATASMANGSVAYIPVRAFITANATTGGTVTLRVTNSAGTVTLGRGSHIIVRRMPTGTTTGAFA